MEDDFVKEMTEALQSDTQTPEAPTEAPTTTPETPETKPEKEDPTPAPSGSDGADIPEEEDTKAPEAPEEEATPPPLTEESIRSIITELRTEERSSTQELESTMNDVLEAYYPEGLSNTLVDESSGKELRTPNDVVEASGGTMTTEEAAQWLMNEQFKLDKSVADIKEHAKKIAETTVKFKRDSQTVIQKYEPLFKAYPQLQGKTWDKYKQFIKADEEKGVIIDAPDMQDFYDFALEPYRLAFEFQQKQPATQPTSEPAKPEPPKPTAEDRMDESGDAGSTVPDDPSDFAAAVKKELANPN